MIEIEKRVNLMIGEYTMNEYKAYKTLVKHKKRINRVFTEVCGDKSLALPLALSPLGQDPWSRRSASAKPPN
jgi:hypothetical protein